MKIAQIGFVAFAMMIWTGDAITVTPQESNAYFAANGLDSNPCTRAAPCLTLDKASAMSYPPGSIINFRGGDTFTGCWFLDPTNVPTGGISSNPIIIQSYGTGRASWIANCPGRFQALFVSSQVSGVIIQNLKLSSGGTQTAVGIGIEGPGDTIIAQDIEVSGFNYNLNGNWGGEIFVASFGSFRRRGCNALNNVQVINSQLHGEQGATSPDAFGISGNGCDGNISNAVYKGNTVYNIGSYTNAPATASGNGIVANSVSVGEVSYNLIHDIGGNTNTCGGPTGIMTWHADRIVVQFNEVYNVAPVVDQGGCDFVGIDFDGGTTNSIAQYITRTTMLARRG